MRRRAEDYPFYDIPGPIAVVHRGGNAAGAELDTENTLEAFHSAHRAGIIYGEVDVVASRDHKAVAYHGAKNPRESAKTGHKLQSVIREMDYSEIRSSLKAGGETIPTLDEVLSTFPDMRFFVDVKSAVTAAPVVKAVRSQRAQDRVSVGSWNYRFTKAVARGLGGQDNIATGLGTLEFNRLKFGYRTGQFLERPRVTSIQPFHSEIGDRMIGRARELGIYVVVWAGSNKAEDNRQYIDRSLNREVHGVLSDHTHELVDAVLSRDLNNGSITELGRLAWQEKKTLSGHIGGEGGAK